MIHKNRLLKDALLILVLAAILSPLAYLVFKTDRAYLSETVIIANRVITLDRDHVAYRTKSESEIASLKTTNSKLSSALSEEQKAKLALETKVVEANDSLNVLKKLAGTDPELLQKYSKVFFLNEHYTPPQLTSIEPAFLVDSKKTIQIHGNVWGYLSLMLRAAKADGVELRVISGYRSFADQSSLKSAYTITYGAGTANKFSADQGYSEHQLGTTVDLSTEKLGLAYTTFEHTNAYSWMNENAHKYGFVLSYPPKNTFYVFEPWHWRYVGVDLATRLHNEKIYFYDNKLTQREIDEYLVKIFD